MFDRIVTPSVLSVAIVAGVLAAGGCTALAQTSAVAATPPKPVNAEHAKDPSPVDQKELAQKEKSLSAKQLFGSVQLPSIGKAVSIGYYPRGCLSGGVKSPVSGSTGQVWVWYG